MKTKVQSLNVAGILMIIFGGIGFLGALFGLLNPYGIGPAAFSIFARLVEIGAGIFAIAFCADRSKAKPMIGLGFAYIATRTMDVIIDVFATGSAMSAVIYELQYDIYDMSELEGSIITVVMVIVVIVALSIHLIVPIIFLTGAFKLNKLSDHGGYGDLPHEYNPYAPPYAPHAMPQHNAPLYPPPYPAYPPHGMPPYPPQGVPPVSFGAPPPPPIMPTPPPFGSVPPQAPSTLFPPPESMPDITDDSPEYPDEDDGPTYSSW